MLKSFKNPDVIEVGCDEAGRGCLAGPVVAAAVILPKDFKCDLLNDSKKMSSLNRYSVANDIKKYAIAFGIGTCTPDEIDEINILNASFLAMHRALGNIKTQFDQILVDGNRFHSYNSIPHECIIKGDGIFMSIAAASVLAKTFRDDYMISEGEKYPHYGWQTNMGYPTKAHRSAIKKFGITQLHRKSFQLLPLQLEIFD